MKALDYIQQQRVTYETREIELPGGGEFSQSEQIARNNANWRSKYYQDGAHDDIIGDYPYDNIVKPIVLLEARATDFDVKHIEVEPARQDRESRVSAMLRTKALHKYAREHNLPKLLDDISFTRAKQGGVFVKKTEDGPEVVPWENVITDQTQIEGVIIERHYYSPSELKKMKGWDNIDEAITTAENSKEADTDKTAKDNITQGEFIEVFELHGEIPVAMLKEAQGEEYEEEENEHEYVQAMIVCTVNEVQNEAGDIENEGIIMFADEEDESPYMYLARNPQVGRGLGESVYESLREHQKWHNYSKTEEARMLAIAGKVLFKTNQPNAMTSIFDGKIDHGTVLPLGSDENGNPNFFEQVNVIPQSTPVYQNMREEWAQSARSTTSAHAAKLGEEAKAGTPFRAQYLQNVEASSQFEKYRKEIGEQLIRPMVEKWILPDAVKELIEEDEIYTTFSPQELMLIDDVIVNKAAIRKMLDKNLAGQLVTPEELEMVKESTRMALRKEGSKRSITKIKKWLKKSEGTVVIHVTDEMRNKAVLFESYANLLNALAPEDPRRDAVIDRIMDSIGVTTEELELYADRAVPTAQGNPQTNPQMEVEQLQAAQSPNAPEKVAA